MNIFNSNKSKKIPQLEEECSRLAQTLKEQYKLIDIIFGKLDKLDWEKRNPPKYKVGAKIKNQIITHIEARGEYGVYEYKYHGIDLKTGQEVTIIA